MSSINFLYRAVTNVLFTVLFLFVQLSVAMGDRDSSVGIASRYGLDGSGVEFRWEENFSALVQTGPRAHPASYTMGTGSLSWG
jgi:hypothetical protein